MNRVTSDNYKVSVVVLSYNSADLLRKLIPKLVKFTKTDGFAQIIIADNNSSDDSVEYIRKEFPDLKLIVFDKNHGYAGGFNKALKHIKTKYLVPLSCDVEVTENWLEPLVSLMEHTPEAGACQPLIHSYRNKSYFEHAGAAGGYIDFLGFPFCRGRIFETCEINKGQYNSVKEIFWTGGCCVLMRTELFHSTGGFDPDFFAHMEEIDLCWRMQLSGYKLLVCPESKVYHYGGFTLDYENPRKLYLNYRNNLAMLMKNWKLGELIIKLPLRFVLDFVAVFYFLYSKGPRHAVSILKGQWDFIRTLPLWMKKRKLVHQLVRNRDERGVYPRSIIVDYYLLKNRTFDKLRWKEKELEAIKQL